MKPASRLTPKQKQLLDFILKFESEHGYAPAQSEIAQYFGFRSLGTVQNYLVRLQRQGVLTKTWNARRGVQPMPVSNPQSTTTIPLLGRVAAGAPIEAITSAEALEVPPSFLREGGTYFALRVQGDSMIEDGILDRDYVIIRQQANAERGQIVVALVDNEATIKRFDPHKNYILLHPANPKYPPMRVDPSTFHIAGILVGVLRHLL